VKQQLRHPRLHALGQFGIPQIFVLEVPGVPHGRVDIADVELPGSGDHALGDGVGAGDHEVVVGQVELLDRDRHQGEKEAMIAVGLYKLLNKGRLHFTAAEKTALVFGQNVEEAEDVGIGEDGEDLFQYPLSTAEGVEPVMNHSDPRLFRQETATIERHDKLAPLAIWH
jgi:hypothetical protein